MKPTQQTTTLNIRKFPVTVKNKFDMLLAKKRVKDKNATQATLAANLMTIGFKTIK